MQETVLNGTILPDGTLKLNELVPLPPGPVEVSVRVTSLGGESTLDVLQEIWEDSQRPGFTSRSAEEIDRDLRRLRDEAESRQRSIEALPARERSTE